MCDERENERWISMYMFVKCEREKEQNIKQHKTNEEKKYCTLIHNIAIFYVVLLRVSVCWGKIRKLCEKTIEYIKNMYGNFPTFGIIFSCPASLLISKVYFFFVSIFKYSFFLFVLDNYHLFYIRIFWLSHFIHLYLRMRFSSLTLLCKRVTCLHT